MVAQIEHMAINVLAIFIMVSASAGAVGLSGGGLQFPLEWLDGTPFCTYAGPGIILGAVVGGSALAAAVQLLRGHALAVPVALGAGLIQVGWIIGELVLVGTPDIIALWLQLLYFTAGAVLALLAAHLLLRKHPLVA
jgi:hypothetical protein